MNTYITELSSLVPACTTATRKLDKLTVLRMAVQRMRALNAGSISSYSLNHGRPSYISDADLKSIVLESAEGFLFVVGCNRGRMLYASQSVVQVLGHSQSDLLGHSWFDILHPKDVAKIKEQLSTSDLTNDKCSNVSVLHNASQMCSGTQRSFFCRMRYKAAAGLKEEADTTTGCQKWRRSQGSDRKYRIVHCTGYLQCGTSSRLGMEMDSEVDGQNCLVVMGRPLPADFLSDSKQSDGSILGPNEFESRHTTDGKFIYVDQRSTLVLGYLPQEVLGTYCYEYYHAEDIGVLAECHKTALRASGPLTTPSYRFQTRDGSFRWLKTKWKAFHNPWTKEVEYLTAFNTCVPGCDVTVVESSIPSSGVTTDHLENTDIAFAIDQIFSSFSSDGDNGGESHPLIGSLLGAGRIGRQIANEALQRKNELSSKDFTTGSKLQLENASHQPEPGVTGRREPGSCSDADKVDSVFSDEALQASNHDSSHAEGNDDAAMAFIMSLLEADAGLGGAVDFSGLPWPLP